MRLIFVFDNGQTTDEAKEKWWKRRETETMTGVRPMPCSAELVFMAELERNGFAVLYPPEIDGDDAVALLAWTLDAAVLSRDRDMLRYEELPRSRIFKDFAMKTGENGEGLVLQPQKAPKVVGVSARSLQAIAEEIAPNLAFAVDALAGMSDPELQAVWGLKSSTLKRRALEDGRSRRGNADAFTKQLGNMNALALPLISAAYRAVGASAPVTMTLPAVDDNGRFLRQETVVDPSTADPSLEAVVRSATQTAAWLREATGWPEDQTSLAFSQREHSVLMIAAEIIDAVLEDDPEAFRAELASLGDFENHPTATARIKAIYNALQTTSALGSAQDVSLGNADSWKNIGRCAGLRNRDSSKCHWNRVVFPTSVQFAQRNSKTPLCDECVTALQQKLAARRY
jgi:hypothetical protein